MNNVILCKFSMLHLNAIRRKMRNQDIFNIDTLNSGGTI